MTAFFNRHGYLVALLCSLLLMLRVGEAHMHRCFDGQEPKATLHLFDIGPEHDGEKSAGHDDQNMSVAGDTSIKPTMLKLDLPLALVIAVVLWPMLPRPRLPRAAVANTSVPKSPDRLRPPLRGPPLMVRA